VIPDFKRVLTLRAWLSLLLMLWCAGAGCMMVSYARAAASDSDESALMDHALGGSIRMDAHACCKAKHRAAKAHPQRAESKLSSESAELNRLTIPSPPTQSGVMNCCPLTTGSIAVASRSQSNDSSTLQLSDSFSPLLVASNPLPRVTPLRLPNRAHSYLLDCAFLI